jgi:hypothetical protein
MIVNVRTKDDLRDLLRNRASGNWTVSRNSEPKITKVRVFNWVKNQVLKGDYDHRNNPWDVNGKLIIGIKNCRIENFHHNSNSIFPEGWPFGTAVVVYSEEVCVQIKHGVRIGIVRDTIPAYNSQREINKYFERLKSEITIRGLDKIVFKAGGNPIPNYFRQWCQNNNVEIEIIPEDELNRQYPIDNDILWEDDLIEDYQ